MKQNIVKSLFIISAVAFSMANSSCKKLEEFGDTDVNNNGASSPITAGLLTSAESRIGDPVAGTIAGGLKAGLYAQYFSETQYPDASTYSEPQLAFSEVYNGVAYNYYTTQLEDLQQIINRNSDPGSKVSAALSGSNANQIAVATILKSYFFWTLTDRWGDLPYSEALKGAGNLLPKYDKQMDMYAQLLKDLKAGVDGFDAGPSFKGDILYNGNNAKWIKLANTLRMFIALRMSKVAPTVAATELNAAATDPGGIIETNADNLVLTFDGGSFKNPYFNTYDGRKDYAYSKTMYDILNNLGDARNAAFGSNSTPFPYGLTRDLAIAFDASVAGGWARFLAGSTSGSTAGQPFNFREKGSPLVIVSASTSLLAKAEGVERGWTAGNTAALYNAGIEQSYAQWNVGSSAAYTSGTKANFASGSGGGSNIGFSAAFPSIVGASANTTTNLQRIQLQRFIAHYPDGVQGWSEWRRTGVPDLKPSAYGTNTPKEIPRRYVYPTSSYSLNPVGAAAAAARLTGGDKMNSRIWWDL